MSDRQMWNPKQYARQAGYVAELGLPVVALLAPRPGERILDLGCGDGRLTEKLVADGGRVVATDASAAQVVAAKARGLDARVMDGQSLSFTDEFDAVFSNAALHWMKRPQPVIAGVWQALRPGGRFVGEFGGGDNIITIKTALYELLQQQGMDAASLDPWYFPTDDAYRSLLEAQGFQVNFIALIPRPTPLPGGIRPWLALFTQSFTAALPAAEVGSFMAEMERRLRPQLCDDAGQWTADYVRLRFAAQKPGEAQRA